MRSTTISLNLQRGATSVELALTVIPFLFLLFGAMEFGRLMYLWNTAQEITRNVARQVVVTDFTDADKITTIRRSALFRTTDGPLAGAPELTDAQINIRYLDSTGAVAFPMPLDPSDNLAACKNVARATSCIRFVEVCLSTGTTCNPDELVSFTPFAPFFTGSAPSQANLTGLHIPISLVRMPAESLGFRPF